MSDIWANDFSDIPKVLVHRLDIKEKMILLISNDSIPQKVTEGGDRKNVFKEILIRLTKGEIDINGAIMEIEKKTPRISSIHSSNNRIFPSGWAERAIRTQFSRFYNQAVMEILIARGETECYVPHSTLEDPLTPCSRLLAGHNNNLKILYQLLIRNYSKGEWTKDVKIPNHPHCTHVVVPIKQEK
jgi:hypothetical protein